MRYIANIITKSKINLGTFFNITNDLNNVDKSIPTLIIGWDEVKKIFPEQNILEKKIDDMLYWTFSKREKRYQYEIDLENFVSRVSSNINTNVNYRFFNFILCNQDRRNDFVNYINRGNCSIYYNSRFLYVYNDNDAITLGISLKDLFYIGINIKSFIKSLNINNNNIICDNLNFIDTESLPLIKDNIKVAAYLNYLKNSDIYKEKSNNG